MATLNSSSCMLWTGLATSPCEDIDFRDYSNKISSTYSVNALNGSLLTAKKPSMSGFSARHRFFGPGSGGLFYVSETGTVLEDAVVAPTNSDSGRIIPTYVEKFQTIGATGGTYVMTSEFKNKRPVYKQVEYNWYIWHDDSADVWVASEAGVNRVGKYLENDSCLPNHGIYSNSDLNEHTLTTDQWRCVEVTNLAGSVDGANGVYCAVATYNEYPTYVHCTSNWFIYRDDAEWVISDEPYNRGGRWLVNGSNSLYTDFNNTSGLNGADEFKNQIAILTSLGVPASALMSEDGDTPLYIEDSETIVTHEG